MQDDAKLIREISIDGAVDYFLPTLGIDPRALGRYGHHRDKLRLTIEEFCVGKTGGTLWLCRSVIWNPQALIGSEGIAFKPANGLPELMWIIDH